MLTIRSLIWLSCLAFCPIAANAQFIRDHSVERNLRSFHTLDGVSRIARSFQSDAEARQQLDRILFAVGLNSMSDRIVLRATAQTSAAEAGIDGKTFERFIFYNATFMQRLNQRTGDYWSLLFVLAHELGHHLAFHVETNGRFHEFELEADRFAGFVLRRMGATLQQTEAAIIDISPEQASVTHPGRADRVQALTIGWTDGGVQGAPQVGKQGKDVAVGIPTEPPAAPKPPSCDGVAVSLAGGAVQCVKPGSGESFKDCWKDGGNQICGPAMVVAPKGDFLMGSPSDETGRTEYDEDEDDTPGKGGKPVPVKIGKDFAVGKFEVTFAEWDACVDAGGCKQKPADQNWGRGNQPVINVSWDEITKEYLPWLSKKTGHAYRLLSEAEWEYAARADMQTRYSFGDSESALGDYGWFTSNSGAKTHPAGQKKPNGWGLHDVHGNVWEWVQDCYADSYKNTPRDGSAAEPTGDCGLRVIRGGSWVDDPRPLRSAFRSRNGPSSRGDILGFRVARTITP